MGKRYHSPRSSSKRKSIGLGCQSLSSSYSCFWKTGSLEVTGLAEAHRRSCCSRGQGTW